MTLHTTSSQTVGPYLHIGLRWLVDEDMTSAQTVGEKFTIEGRMIDGDGKPVNDAVVEIWQANAHGRYAHPEDTQDKPLDPSFTGFGRVFTGDDGAFRIITIKPGPFSAPGGAVQAPHLNVTIFARGLLKQLVTRLYFPNEQANEDDAILQSVSAERRGTLIAQPVAARNNALSWNVILQGERETVFFDY